MKVVLDTSAILAGLQFDDDKEYFITDETLREIKDKDALLRIEVKRNEDSVRIAAPEERSIQAVKKKLGQLGEEESLSEADVMALSLALELKERGEEVVLATDDYGIQNVAGSLSISYATVAEKGIKKILTWHFICTGCGQGYDKNVVLCEICGSKVKRRAAR